MPEPLQITMPLLEIPVTSVDELAFAEGATSYLEKQGLDHQAVVKCLIEELELDLATAEALADLAA